MRNTKERYIKTKSRKNKTVEELRGTLVKVRNCIAAWLQMVLLKRAFVASHGPTTPQRMPAAAQRQGRPMGVPAQCYPLVEWPGVLRISCNLKTFWKSGRMCTINPFPPPQMQASRRPPAHKASWAPRILRRTRSVGMSSMHTYVHTMLASSSALHTGRPSTCLASKSV